MQHSHPIPRNYIFLLLSLVLILCSSAQAAYLRNIPMTVTQPDGTKLSCFATGDEYCNWIHDAKGYTIIKDPQTGYYVYAIRSNGEPAPSSYIAGKADPFALGLEPRVIPSVTQYQEKKVAFDAGYHALNPRVSNAPQTGTINNVVIFIRFNDETGFSEGLSTVAPLFNGSASGNISLLRYYQEASYNKLTINTTFYPAASGDTILSYQDTNPRAYYQPYNSATNTSGYTSDSDRTNREHTLLYNAVNAVKSQIPSSLNVDTDGDGYVDNVCFIVDGTSGDWNSLLWPHQWYLYTKTAYINGKQVYGYNFQLEDILLQQGASVLCHEMFHTLGAPDLYHYTDNGIEPTGYWDLMSYNLTPPQHMSSYMKYRYGKWISSIPEITASGDYTLNSLISSTNNCYKIASPYSSTEYFVLEYREKTGDFESSLPGSGLIVWRINTAEDGKGNQNGPPDEVYVYRPGGTTTTNGTITGAFFSQGSGRTAINDTTNPSSFLTDGSVGGLNISNVGVAGSTISFHVNIVTNNQIATPTFSPAAGWYQTAQDVSISCATSGATIHYTTNGNDPTESDPVYSSPIHISQTTTLKAKAWKTGMDASATAAATYTIGTKILYVNPNSTSATHDGQSWATGYLNISNALSAATSGTDIWVAAGTYTSQITLKDQVAIYGGFSGTETDLSQRDIKNNVTILDGGSSHVVVSVPSTCKSGVVLDGFTIQNGKYYDGAGVYCGSGSVCTLSNNILKNNYAPLYNSSSDGLGAAIFCNGSQITIFNNEFTGNTAEFGGAAMCLYGSSCNVLNNIIHGNTAQSTNYGYGGAILCMAGSDVIANNIIYGNTASLGNAIMLTSNGATDKTYMTQIINNTIADNTDLSAGAILNYDSYMKPNLYNNIIAYNSGYGIYANGGSTCTLSNNCLYSNEMGSYANISAGSGDITSDPGFIDRSNHDYHIAANSPCIDAGNDSVIQTGWVDIDGKDRIFGAHVDIGADEAVFTSQYSSDSGFIQGGRWNLFSLPADPVNGDPLQVLAGIDVANANLQYWTNEIDPPAFQNYGSSYGWTGPLVRGDAYWLIEPSVTTAKQISYNGLIPTGDFILNLPSHTSAPYWVLFGTPFPSSVSCSSIYFKDSIKRGDNWLTWTDAYSESNTSLRVVDSGLQAWDASQNTFVRVAPTQWAQGGTDSLTPWWGYWLLVMDGNPIQIKFPKP